MQASIFKDESEGEEASDDDDDDDYDVDDDADADEAKASPRRRSYKLAKKTIDQLFTVMFSLLSG